MEKKLVFTVAKDGDVQIDAIGFKGTECNEATKAFENALGQVDSKKKKPEFYEGNLKTTKDTVKL